MDADHFDALTRALRTIRSRRGTLFSLLGGSFGLLGRTETMAKKHGKRRGKTRRGECGRCRNGHCMTNDEFCRSTYGGGPCIACDIHSLRCAFTNGIPCGPCQVCQAGGVCRGCSMAEQDACLVASFDCRVLADQQHCDCRFACGDNVSCQDGCRSQYVAQATICLHDTPGCFQSCGDGEVSCSPDPTQPGICV